MSHDFKEEIPLVSIITVVYNGVKTIEQTIQSVLNQTYESIEYIIIDGGSTDGTIDIIKNYEEKITYWVSEPDNGLYDAMNKGIIKAKGKLIGLINSDDWYEPNAIELIVTAYKNNSDKRIFHGDRYDVLENGDKVVREFNKSKGKFIYLGMTYNHPGMFVHHEIYNEHIYNPELDSLSDYQFVLTLYLKDSSLFQYINEVYVNFRLGGISAELGVLSSLKEGFQARKNAGLDLINNILSMVFRFLFFIIYKPFIRLKNGGKFS